MARNSETTVTDLLAAAARLFVSRPYDDLKLSDIAGACGVTKGAIYHHFSSKEDIFLSMMARKLGALGEALRPGLTCSGTTRERLIRLTSLYLGLPPEDQRVMELVRRDSQRFQGEARTRLIRQYQAALPGQVEQIIQDGMLGGEVIPGDARLFARLYVAHVEIYLSDDARSHFDDAAQMARYVTDLFLRGAAPRDGDGAPLRLPRHEAVAG